MSVGVENREGRFGLSVEGKEVPAGWVVVGVEGKEGLGKWCRGVAADVEGGRVLVGISTR